MTAKANAQRGFTLLEVMVAFAIAAMSVTLLAEIFGKAAVNAGHAREVSGALNVAESVLDEASVSHATIEDNGIQGVYSWTLQREPYVTTDAEIDNKTAAKRDYGLTTIKVEVVWPGPRGQARLELQRLALLEQT